MVYSKDLIHFTEELKLDRGMYALMLVKAKALSITLSGVRSWLDGMYLFCLSEDDRLTVHSGEENTVAILFRPYFYNVNLDHRVVGHPIYNTMQANFGYPDFHLFLERTSQYYGILALREEEYRQAESYFRLAERHISLHDTDEQWSCRTRSDIISLMGLGENVYSHNPVEAESEIIIYVREHLTEDISIPSLCERFHTNRTSLNQLFKEKTGLPPLRYVLEERLNQSRPDLLFTLIPVQQLAEKYGFSDVNYYIRAFKRRFGKSPLQYRKEGWEDRISNETKYHLLAEAEMTDAEFEDALNKGLGRAILTLQKQKPTESQRNIVKKYCKNMDEHLMSTGLYERDLMECFPSDAQMKHDVKAALLEKLYRGEAFRSIPLLQYLEAEREVRAILDMLYDTSYAAVIAYMEHKQKASSVLPDDIPECAFTLRETIVARVKNGFADRAALKKMLFDLADLFDYSDRPPVPRQTNPLFRIWDCIGTEEIFRLLDEVEAEHRHGGKLHLKNEAHPMPSKEVEEIFTAEAFLSDSKPYADVYKAFASAGEEEIRKIAEAAVSETDRKRKAELLMLFCPDPMQRDEVQMPVFPLDPNLLIEQLTPEGWADADKPKEGSCLRWILVVLSRIRHPEVAKLGQKLRDYGRFSAVIKGYGVKIWASNWTPMDKRAYGDTIRSLCEKTEQNNELLASYLLVLKQMAKDGLENLPLDVLPEVWHKIERPLNRITAAEALLLGDAMPDALREECRLDCVAHIRKLAEGNSEIDRKTEAWFLSKPK